MAGPGDHPLLLSAHGVSRRYGPRIALEPTDVEVSTGEVLALVGPNGAGKSTLLGILAGSLRASAGRVEVGGTARSAGWAPQRPALYRHLSARENLELFARLQGLADPGVEALHLLEAVGLEEAHGPASRLSVGSLQRLNIAVALLGRPDVLLLDEPTASLDPGQRRRVWEIVDGVRARGGGVVFATHYLEEVERHATRAIALVGGRVAFSGSPEELVASHLLEGEA